MDKKVSKLDASVIRKIATGQVILDIANVCKELIENALDAGATSIDIRVVNHGLTSLEIFDNGQGIQEADFENLARAHYTSKLANFEEICSLKTFGFRGEALNALTAMSKLTVTTRHGTVGTGTKLEFDTKGTLIDKSPSARTVGTTVTVEQFLEPLPVRRKGFEQNAKKEYQKLLNIVQAYCLILKNVRIELSHRPDNGQKKTILSIYPNNSLRENVCNIYGADQLKSLIEFVQVSPLKEQLAESGFLGDAPVEDFKLEGLVSTIDKGAGRGTPDRQFIFVNQRPCDFAKILKGINEIYHQYNRQQFPIVILNIDVKGKVDVNVTPDKRQVLVANEDLLHFVIKTSLTILYEKLQGVCKLGEASSLSAINTSTISNVTRPSDQATTSSSTSLDRFKRHYQPSNLQSPRKSVPDLEDGHENAPPPKQLRLASEVLNVAQTNGSSVSTATAHLQSPERRPIQIDTPVSFERTSGQRRSSDPFSNGSSELVTFQRRRNFDKASPLPSERPRSTSESKKPSYQPQNYTLDSWLQDRARSVSGNSTGNQSSLSIHAPRRRLILEDIKPEISHRRSKGQDSESEEDADEIPRFRRPSRPQSRNDEEPKSRNKAQKSALPVDIPWSGTRKRFELPFSFEALRRYHMEKSDGNDAEESDADATVESEFRAKITRDENKQAELELKRCLKKSDFAAMTVIGQFNKGFIIARLNDDLFIIDQHASDEKYNFESLQKSAKFQSQKLLSPLQLEFSPAQEQILVTRREVFRKNGFEFIADSHSPPGKRFKLSAIPHSSSCTFDKSDIDEIIAILDDDPSVKMYRPVKFRGIYASKACRMSVMIGTALSKSQMENILRHLAEIDQPWNCPHGRPTVRHLFNMRQIQNLDDDR